MPIDTEQWRAQTGLFCASRVLLRPPRCKQPKPKVQADTLSLNMKFSLAVLLVTLRTGVFYVSRTLQLFWLIACDTSWILSSIIRLSCKRLRGVSVLLALCLVVMAMLLIMSGDVEENPGPPKMQSSSLGMSDLSCVREELLDVSHKWFDVGLKLQLSVGTLECIRDQYPSPSTSLREMLLHWLKKVDPPPTWEGLACALESRTVGEPRLAEQLRTKYCKTVQADGGPVEHPCQPLAFREMRPVPHPPIYGPIPPSPGHTPVDQYASYLRSVYTSKKLPTYSKWPPSSSTKYIHLAVVKKKKVSKQKADEFTRATIHGTEIDDIYQQKEAVDFSKVGKSEDGSLAKLILVEGSPGIGKTTFAWEACRKWADGEILQDYGLVVLLRLRDKRVREVKTIFDLFHHPNSELSIAVGTEILHHEGQSVLLLYEGYDELPRRLQVKQSIFLDVLHKEYLPRATILITSRPSATGYLHWEFRKQISQHIEILGFTKDDIISYVNDVMENEQLSRDFLQYLKCYPYIRGMMYVPLNAVIVTEVYKTSQQSPKQFIPTTMTELYTALTQSLLLRYLHSHGEYGQQQWNLKGFTDLPKELYEQFGRITEVALNGMIEDKFVFDDLPNDFNTLDLMQSVPELYVEQGALISYNFFHLTLQEYLAAVNISQQPVKKQIQLFLTSSRPETPNYDGTNGSKFDVGSWYSSSDEEFASKDPKATIDRVNTSQPLSPQKTSFLDVTPPHTQFPTSRHHTQSVLQHQQPECFHHPTSLGESLFYPLPPQPSHQASSTFSTLPPEHSRLNPYAQPFVPQHQYLTSDVSPFPVSSYTTFSTCTPIQSIPTQQLMPSIVPPHPLPSATLHHPPHTTAAPPTPEMLHPFSHTVMRPRAPEHFQQQWPHSLYQANLDPAPVHYHPTFNELPNEQLLHPHLFIPHPPDPPPLIPSSYTESRLHPPHPTVTPPPTPRMTHPFSPSMSTHDHNMSADFKDDCTHHDTLRTLPTGQMGLSTLTSVRTGVDTISTPSTTVPQSGASSTRLSLPDINVPGISTRLRNVLRFVAGLTKFNCIPLPFLQYLLLRDHGKDGTKVTLKSLHWLFETQCSDTYNEIVSNSHHLTFTGTPSSSTVFSIESKSTMSPFDCFVLGYAIAHVTCKWEVDLTGTNIDDEDVEMIVAGMNFDKKIIRSGYSVGLVLYLCKITSQGLKHVCQNITEVHLYLNKLGSRETIILAELLKENRTLQQLDIIDNSIGQGGATALAEMLKENRTLQVLNVTGNSIGQGGATALAEMLKENRTLQVLSVGSNSIGQGGATVLAEILKENRTLRCLNINRNSIGQGGATKLAEMLKENRTLQKLIVSGNSIGQGGTTALAEMLKENQTLQYLDIGLNSIGQGGATTLAEMLKENRTLQQLIVNCTSIGQRGAVALAEMLKENMTIQMLIVSGNSIGQGGATALAKMLKENRTLQHLDIGGNSIGQGGAKALAEMLKENNTLKELYVFDTSIGKEGVTMLVESLTYNTALETLGFPETYLVGPLSPAQNDRIKFRFKINLITKY